MSSFKEYASKEYADGVIQTLFETITQTEMTFNGKLDESKHIKFQETDNGIIYGVKLSNLTPSPEEWIDGKLTLVYNGGMRSITITESHINEYEEGYWYSIAGDAGIIVILSEDNSFGLTTGIWGLFVPNTLYVKTLSYPGYIETIKLSTIDSKYLPGDLIKSVNNTTPDENGNVNVLGWEETKTVQETIEITWDGKTTDGYETLNPSSTVITIKLSDTTPAAEDWIGKVLIKYENGTEYKTDITEEDIVDGSTIDAPIDCYYVGNSNTVMVALEEFSQLGITPGVWAISNLDIDTSEPIIYPSYIEIPTEVEKEVIHTIDPKFLPEGIGYEQEAFTFDGDLNKVEYIGGDGTYYIKCSDQIPEPEDWLGGSFEMTDPSGNGTVIIDQTFFDSNFQDLESYYGFLGVIVVRTSFSPTDGLSFTPGIWILYAPEIPLIVNKVVCPGVSSIHKIDAKYLPEGVGYDEEIPAHTLILTWDGVVAEGQEVIYDEATGQISSVKIYDKFIPKESWNGAKLTAFIGDGTEEEIILEDELYSTGIRANEIPGSYIVLLTIGVFPENVKVDESFGEIFENMSGVWLAPHYNDAGDMGYFSKIELNIPATTEPVTIEPQYLPEGIGYETEDIRMSILFDEEVEGFITSNTTKATYTADTSVFNLADLTVNEAYIVDIDWFGPYELTLKKIEQDSTIIYGFEKVIDEYESFTITETIEGDNVTTDITLNVSRSASTSYHFSIVGPKSYGMQPVKIDEKYIPDTIARISDLTAPKTEFILASSTEGSTKQFKITVDDSGTLTATEINEN